VCALILLLALFPYPVLAADPLPQQDAYSQGDPGPADEYTAAREFGYGVGSVLASVFYSPAKVTYAGLGLITGGLGYVLSAGNGEVSSNIIHPAIRGNYIVTPRNLKGEKPLYFVGPPPPLEPQPGDQAQLPAPMP
jgi:hypothetical protein